MNPKPIIETKRLRIRDLLLSDLDAFYFYRSNPAVTKYQGFDVFTRGEAESFIKMNAKRAFGQPGQWVQYAIEHKTTGKPIGDCALRLLDDVRMGEIGITISHTEQQKGYAKETMLALLGFLFSLEGFHRVTETVDAENMASIRLLQSVGFRQEGHFIENIFFKGKWGSEKQFALLAGEWKEIKNNLKI